MTLLSACGGNEKAGTFVDSENPDRLAVLSFASVTPTSGLVTGGTSVTILGSGFTEGLSILFGTEPCTDVVITSSTEVTCRTPAHLSGSASITLALADEELLTADAFSYGEVAPTYVSIFPTGYINTKSTTLTIDGTGFVDTVGSQTRVTIGGQSCESVTVVSASQLTCTSPIGVDDGPADVVVTNPDDQSATGSGAFDFRTPPTFTELNSTGDAGVFGNKCSNCHGVSGGLTLSDYASVSERVTPGDPTTSLIWQRINGIGNLMPLGGPMMDPEEIEFVADWILNGALDN